MRIMFLLKESLSGYRRYKISFFLTVFSIFIALSLLGFFGYFFINGKLVVNDIRNRVEVEAFFYDYVTDSQAVNFINIIKNHEGINKVNYISKEQAKHRFIKETGINFQEILSYNPLPSSVTIEIKSEYLSKEYIKSLKTFLINSKLFSDVVYNQELLDIIESRTLTFQKILFIIFTIITIATIILISNTIRLAMFNKLDVINTMRLVGATHFFIKLPFLLEGILVGFIGGVLASGFVIAIHLLLQRIIIIELLITKHQIILLNVSLIVLGCIFGFLGSLFTIKRFLKQSAFPK